jgi:predicted aldo/keto reductase-like oxidoreductase
MKDQHNKVNRRDFMKTLGAAGLSAGFASRAIADSNEPNTPAEKQQTQTPQVPTRKFGKTGQDVSELSLGAIQLVDNQVILTSSLKWGVTYWDTAYGYTNGNSELCIGKFMAARPEIRKKLFIVSKASHAGNVKEAEERLLESLKRMNTDYVDLYYGVHGLDYIAQLTPDYKIWAENMKKQGKIRYFGFSTHKNMASSLAAAAKLGWVDAILTTYNFRLMKNAEMQNAVDACHKAGVALTAMKTQALRVENEEEKKLMEHFTAKGFTEGQAKIKAVLEDERIPAVTVSMNSVALINENVAAVLDKTKLAADDRMILEQYANDTCDGYCAGCAHICDGAIPQAPYVSDVMRSLMYHNNYGDKQLARQSFAQIPAEVRNRLTSIDYSTAEARCPQRMPIGRLMKQAVDKLA